MTESKTHTASFAHLVCCRFPPQQILNSDWSESKDLWCVCEVNSFILFNYLDRVTVALRGTFGRVQCLSACLWPLQVVQCCFRIWITSLLISWCLLFLNAQDLLIELLVFDLLRLYFNLDGLRWWSGCISLHKFTAFWTRGTLKAILLKEVDSALSKWHVSSWSSSSSLTHVPHKPLFVWITPILYNTELLNKQTFSKSLNTAYVRWKWKVGGFIFDFQPCIRSVWCPYCYSED